VRVGVGFRLLDLICRASTLSVATGDETAMSCGCCGLHDLGRGLDLYELQFHVTVIPNQIDSVIGSEP
jgi:hypothetical protein